MTGIDGAARLRSVQFRRLWTFYDSWAMDVTADDRSLSERHIDRRRLDIR